MKHAKMLSAVLVFLLVALACGTSETNVGVAPSTEEIKETPPSEVATESASEGEVDTGLPSHETAALSSPVAGTPASGLDQAWLGGFNSGVTLLDSEGQWWGFRKEGGILSTNQIYDIAIGPTGDAWVVDSLGIRITDGQTWRDASTDFSGGAEAIAINAASGHVWVVDYKRASVFDGVSWTTYKSRNFGESDYVDQAEDVAIDPQGFAWVATGSSVAMFDGSEWTVWEEDAGFSKRYFIDVIAAGQDGRIWVGHSNGVLLYDGAQWTEVGSDRLSQVQDIAVAPDGRVWVATWNDGVGVFDGLGWIIYDRGNSGLISDRVRSIAFDSSGRVWLGTTWGLSVFDGANWVSYTMSTSGLAGSRIEAIAVGGIGPVLPSPTAPKLGSITGLIMQGTQPVENAQIVLCSDKPGMIFRGPHPCADYPFFYEATTNAEGRYTFIDIPVGEYQTTWRVPDGQWMGYLIGGGKIVVEKDTMNEAPTLDASSP